METTTTDRTALEQKLIPELQRIAQEMGIEGTQRLRKSGLIDAIVNGGNGAGESSPQPSAVAERTGDRRSDDRASDDASPSEGDPEPDPTAGRTE